LASAGSKGCQRRGSADMMSAPWLAAATGESGPDASPRHECTSRHDAASTP
jgi:hypothetical protein